MVIFSSIYLYIFTRQHLLFVFFTQKNSNVLDVHRDVSSRVHHLLCWTHDDFCCDSGQLQWYVIVSFKKNESENKQNLALSAVKTAMTQAVYRKLYCCVMFSESIDKSSIDQTVVDFIGSRFCVDINKFPVRMQAWQWSFKTCYNMKAFTNWRTNMIKGYFHFTVVCFVSQNEATCSLSSKVYWSPNPLLHKKIVL